MYLHVFFRNARYLYTRAWITKKKRRSILLFKYSFWVFFHVSIDIRLCSCSYSFWKTWSWYKYDVNLSAHGARIFWRSESGRMWHVPTPPPLEFAELLNLGGGGGVGWLAWWDRQILAGNIKSYNKVFLEFICPSFIHLRLMID